ncbi:MAG: hypothetical protein E7207_05625 [Clostridium butyricum]|nr:hypothetical protein [Clostridium butyricum]
MLTATEERLLEYIERCAKENIEGKTFFRMTDVLEDAFLLTEDKAYDALKNIMSRKNIGNSKYDVVEEYIDMLKKGYGSIQEQVDVYGGDKYMRVVTTAEKRMKNYEGGTFFDVLREIYHVPEEEIMPLVEKYLNFVKSPGFKIRLEEETYHDFLQSNVDELEKQFQRFMDLKTNEE